jgi:hypothetical protein
MKIFYALICLLFAIPSQAQNLLFNGDFRMEGGSLTGWGYTENTELVQDGAATFARFGARTAYYIKKLRAFRQIFLTRLTSISDTFASGKPLVTDMQWSRDSL